MASEDTSWRTPTFRQSVVAKIDEAIRRSGMPTSKNSLEMENHVFQKAKSREEYLGFVARLILHVREMNSKKTAGMPGSGGPGPGGQGMPDPINALQTLARQGTANAQMISHMGGAPQGTQGAGMNQSNPIMGIAAGAQQGMMQQQQQSPQQGQMSATGLLQTIGHQGRGTQQQVVLGGMQSHQGKLPPGMASGPPQGGSMGSVTPQMQSQMQQIAQFQQQQQQQQQQHQQQLQQQHQQLQPQQQQQQLQHAQQQLQHQQQLQQQQMQQLQQRKMVEGIVMGGMVGGPGGGMVSGAGGAMVGGPGNAMVGGPGGSMVGGGNMVSPGGAMVGGPGSSMVGGPGGGMTVSSGSMVTNQGGIVSGPGSMNVGQGVVGGNQQQQFVVGGAVRPGSSTPNQYLRSSPSPASISQVGGSGVGPASAPSPASGHGGSIPSNQMNQMAPSPAMVASPSPQMTPLGGPPGSVGAQRSVGMAPSPSSCLNTPGQPVGGGPTPSPCNPLEDQAYREKVRQLSKYIEPLRRMIARMGNDDVEKLSKMKKLLEILSNPSKRMPLETLLKCEVVLEKLDLKRNEGCGAGSVPPLPLPPPLPPPIQLSTLKEHHIFSPLLESVSNHLNSLVINHTLQRTFGPTMEALFGPEIKMLPPPLKRNKPEDVVNDIPDVLQGEIARLDQRFKVSLDPTQHPGSRSVHLVCWLDDRHLPCVPPISLTVPGDYPSNPPKCELSQQEYGSTPFLSTVQKALWSRVSKLPSQYSISQLLDTWEMSVRQASSPASQLLQQTAVDNFPLTLPILSHQPSTHTVAMGL